MRNSFVYPLSLCVLALNLAACGDDKNPAVSPATLRSTAKSSQVLTYANAASEKAKIFLVAGGRDDANFSQEILNQKAHWLAQGANEEDIECFYTRPFDSEYEADQAQYDKLAPGLRKCRPANSGLVLSTIKAAAAQGHSYVYLYVTGHGAADDSVQKVDAKVAKDNPFLNQFWLALDASPVGEPMDLDLKIEAIKKDNASAETYLLTPAALKAALETFAPATKKFVVLQACHSGGFVDTPNKKLKADTLVNVSNMMVMTASRWDRTSFGCSAGLEQTYFGEAMNEALKTELQLPNAVNWNQIYQKTNAAVSAKETEKDFTPSLPVFFSNQIP